MLCSKLFFLLFLSSVLKYFKFMNFDVVFKIIFFIIFKLSIKIF